MNLEELNAAEKNSRERDPKRMMWIEMNDPKAIVAGEKIDTSIDAIAADLLLLAHAHQDVHTVVDTQTLTATMNTIAATVDIDTTAATAIGAIEVINTMEIEVVQM